MSELQTLKICELCKKEIPYLRAVNGGQQYRCPLCGKVVDYFKCFVKGEKPISTISNLDKPEKLKLKEIQQLTLCLQ